MNAGFPFGFFRLGVSAKKKVHVFWNPYVLHVSHMFTDLLYTRVVWSVKLLKVATSKAV
jgi:hypothetical protein